MRQRPGQKVFTVPGPEWGVRVIEPGPQAAGGGWWDDFGAIACCVGAYQARAAANYAASLVNLANPGVNDLVEGNGALPWNAVNGWQFVAAALQYFLTGLIPAADQSWSALIQFANAVNMPQWAFGIRADGGGRIFGIQPNNGAVDTYWNGNASNVAPGLAAGNLGFAGNQGYRNGVADGGAIGGWTGGNAGRDIYLGCYNQGAPQRFQTLDMHTISFYDCTLTAPQMLAVATNMAAL